MTIESVAGTTLKISASTPATYDGTGYAALTYTTVGEVTDLGEFGRVYFVDFDQTRARRRTVQVQVIGE